MLVDLKNRLMVCRQILRKRLQNPAGAGDDRPQAASVRRSMFPRDISTVSAYLSGSSPISLNRAFDPTLPKHTPVSSTSISLGESVDAIPCLPLRSVREAPPLTTSRANPDRIIRLSSKVVIRPRPLTNEFRMAESTCTSTSEQAFFQAWINARPSLSLSEFITVYNSGDKTIMECIKREHKAVRGKGPWPVILWWWSAPEKE